MKRKTAVSIGVSVVMASVATALAVKKVSRKWGKKKTAAESEQEEHKKRGRPPKPVEEDQ